MLSINKMISTSAVDYAAEELKKYLRMMMPECGDIKVAYNPLAADGFRLGLMQDFGLDTSDAEDTELDDILYIDCDEKGGIIAGDNPRSVLLSVYEYLRQNGCRWLFPGIDGEYIPMQDIVPVKYRHKPTMRYRGFCNEGAEYQQCVLDAIEFIPKVGMNVFMIEFRIPKGYYSNYYLHRYNEENRAAEGVSLTQILQWKRQCEAEIAKRGLQFHDIGHGFNADSFGIDSSWRSGDPVDHNTELTEEQISIIALRNGKRELRGNCPNWTNFCMSNKKAQKMFATAVADYAEKHSNEDYLHVALADGHNGHCECEACQKKSPSDYYVILLNMIDEELSARGLNTRIVFAAYVDTSWAPIVEKVKNQDRFSLLFCPITRDYTTTLSTDPSVRRETVPYVRNNITLPSSLDEYFAYLNDWKKSGWHGNCISYEYHFWVHQYLDLTGIAISKVINEDVRVYKEKGINGIIEDGSQRSFFPTGLPFYTYARSLFDSSLSAEEIAKDYYDTAFGDGAEEIYAYMKELSEAIKYEYMQRKLSDNIAVSPFYSPTEAESIKKTRSITERGGEIIKKYYNSDYRVQTVSVRLLESHAEFVNALSDALYEKAIGNDDEADALLDKLRIDFGKKEAAIQAYYDHYLEFYAQKIYVFKIRSNKEELSIMGGQ